MARGYRTLYIVWFRLGLMANEIDYLRATVLEQGLALVGLRRVAEDAEERQNSSHTELLGMMAALLKRS